MHRRTHKSAVNKNDAVARMKPSLRAASAGFNTCPMEILFLVFKLLSPVEFRILCLVNKSFRAVAEQFLYSEIKWTWIKAHPPPPIIQLLRTILFRPQLAGYIKKVHLTGDTFRQQEFRSTIPKIPVCSAELDDLLTFIRGADVKYGELWARELRQGTIDAFVALFLAQVPNLRCLYLSHNFIQKSALIGMVLRSAICEPVDNRLPNFENLRDASFLLANDQDGARDKKVKNTADVLPFLYLPNLEHLSASIENPISFTWPAADSPDPSSLRSLDLTWIRESYLGELLAVTRNLESLRWHWYFDTGVSDQFITQILDVDRLVDSISHVRGTLTDLTISADVSIGGSDPFYPAVWMTGSLQSIVGFYMLKRLRVPWPLLVGFTKDTTKRLQDMIPRNIESLVITDDLRIQNEDGIERAWPEWEWTHPAILKVLQSWLADWKAYTPHLRRISLVLSVVLYELNDWCSVLTHKLRELSTQVGVELELINLTDEA